MAFTKLSSWVKYTLLWQVKAFHFMFWQKKNWQTPLRFAGPNTVYSCINKYRVLYLSEISFKYKKKRPRYSKNNCHTRRRRWFVWFQIALAPRRVHCVGCTTAVFPRICFHFDGPHQTLRPSAGGRGCQQTSQPIESLVADAVLIDDRRRLLILSPGRK